MLRGIFEFYELALTLESQYLSPTELWIVDLPKLKSVWTSRNEVGVDNVLVFVDAEVTSSNLAVPIHSALTRD